MGKQVVPLHWTSGNDEGETKVVEGYIEHDMGDGEGIGGRKDSGEWCGTGTVTVLVHMDDGELPQNKLHRESAMGSAKGGDGLVSHEHETVANNFLLMWLTGGN